MIFTSFKETHYYTSALVHYFIQAMLHLLEFVLPL